MTQARLDHPERLAHAGSLSRPAHVRRASRANGWLVFVVIVVVALLAAHVALTIITH